jgi:exopolyphosphatase / guanosine-5'-triphosphate,3'-diphosphate pyrophosphatase
MEPIRRAVIDVGTNSVKLLLAEIAGHDIRPVREESKQTRLGHDFYGTHRLQPDAIAATAEAVAAFARMARQGRAASIRVLATSAAREAVNAADLTAAIQQAAGLPVEVISGEQEAALGFAGVTTDPRFSESPLLLLDVGGGSTQVTLGQAGRMSLHGSFAIGSVRLLEQRPPSDPPQPGELAACRAWVRSFLRAEVRPKLGYAGHLGAGAPPGTLLVGVGGTASILGCMEAKLETFDRARLESTRLGAARILWHLEHLWSLPLAERKHLIGLPKNRADVILMGTVIYQAFMDEFALNELQISTRGLRFAALLNE